MATTKAIPANGPIWIAQAFLLSLLVPFSFQVGTLLLMPHRILLLVFFFPAFIQVFVLRRAGGVHPADWLLFGSTLWAGLALAVNNPEPSVIESIGIHIVEFFGGYLIARVSIRSSADFRRLVRTFFLILLILVPFAAAESLTYRPVLLDLLPGNTVGRVDAGIRLGMRRAQTVFAHPILFGVFVSTGLGLFWYALRPRGLRFLAVPVAVLGTIFSLSTGALIAVVAQSVFIGWETILKTVRVRWKLFFSLAAAGYLVIDLLSNRSPFHVLVTYATFNTGSAYNRILIWKFGTDNIWANPFLGIGLNDWVRPSWMSSSVDNFWLLLAMQYGIPAIGMIFAALALIFVRAARADLPDPDDQLCRAAYLVAFGGLFIAGGTVHYWHAMMAFVMFIFGSGLWTITGGAKSDTTNNQDEATPQENRSRYTRQTASGVPISAQSRTRPASSATKASSAAKVSHRQLKSSRDRALPAAPLSRPSRRTP